MSDYDNGYEHGASDGYNQGYTAAKVEFYGWISQLLTVHNNKDFRLDVVKKWNKLNDFVSGVDE